MPPMESLVVGRHCERSEAINSFFARQAGLLRCARNDDEAPSLGGRQMANLTGDLVRHRRRPWRAAAALHVDFHPEHFPSARWPDAVHGGGTLDAARMGVVEEHEGLGAAGDFFDLLPQPPAV